MFERKMVKLLIVAAFFAITLLLLADVIGADSPWLGFLLMFYFMALAKVAEPLFVLRLPRPLRDVDPAVAARPLYRRVGVRGFGRLLRDTPLRHLNNSVYRDGGRRSLAQLRRQAESAEATHFWAAVLFTPYIAWVATRGQVAEAAFFVVVQIAFNLYPILHLRLLRARLAKLTAALAARTAATDDAP